jgi:hypothetical protein
MNGCRIHGAANRSSCDAVEILALWKGYILARIRTKLMSNAAFEMIRDEIDRLKAIADDAERAVGLGLAKLKIATNAEYAPHRANVVAASYLY